METIWIDDTLLLRTWQTEDASGLFDAIDRSRAHLHPWLDWVDKTTRLEHTIEYIAQSMHQLDNQEGMALGIFFEDRIAGSVGMHNWDLATKRAEIGYWIGKEYEGKGIMNRCLTAFIDFLFYKTGLNKIEIRFLPSNKRSARVASVLGFKIEGVIRHSVMRNGLPDDMVVMGLLRSEWANIRASA